MGPKSQQQVERDGRQFRVGCGRLDGVLAAASGQGVERTPLHLAWNRACKTDRGRRGSHHTRFWCCASSRTKRLPQWGLVPVEPELFAGTTFPRAGARLAGWALATNRRPNPGGGERFSTSRLCFRLGGIQTRQGIHALNREL